LVYSKGGGMTLFGWTYEQWAVALAWRGISKPDGPSAMAVKAAYMKQFNDNGPSHDAVVIGADGSDIREKNYGATADLFAAFPSRLGGA